MSRLLGARSELRLAASLCLLLLLINLWLNPARFAVANLGATLGLAAPLILAACASLPPILSGRGGIDLSVGPLMGLVNVVVVRPGFVHTKMTEGLKPAPFSTEPGVVAVAAANAIEAGRALVWAPAPLRVVMSGLRHLPRPIFRRLSN